MFGLFSKKKTQTYSDADIKRADKIIDLAKRIKSAREKEARRTADELTKVKTSLEIYAVERDSKIRLDAMRNTLITAYGHMDVMLAEENIYRGYV